MENNNQQAAVAQGRAYPPGYRFMPTDVELITQYLAKRVNNEPIPVAEMSEVNLYQYTPHYLAENYPQLGDKEHYFFTPRERKYPNGNRPKRSVEGRGYWKATGADKLIYSSDGVLIGKKKALVFYLGKPKSGVEQKTNWIMHEYKLNTPSRCPGSNDMRLDDWVLCRIREKPTRSNNKKQKEVEVVVDDGHGHVSDDDVDEDQENVEQLVVENVGNVEGLASLQIENQISGYNGPPPLPFYNQNQNPPTLTINYNQFNQHNQKQPTLPPNYHFNQFGYGFDQMEMEASAAVPNNYVYGQNGYGMPCNNYLNEQQVFEQQDFWGNIFHHDQLINSGHFSLDGDDVPSDVDVHGDHDDDKVGPKRKRN